MLVKIAEKFDDDITDTLILMMLLRFEAENIKLRRNYIIGKAEIGCPKHENARKSTNMAPGSKNSIGSKHVVLDSYIIRV